jgi:hypothetical protein
MAKLPPEFLDEVLASEFLTGLWFGGRGGQRRYVYVKARSDREREARAALARLLGKLDRELSHNIRARLAALIDPEAVDEPRELVIQKRSGRQPNRIRDVQIAFDIAAAGNIGSKMADVAWEDTAKRYGVSVSTVKRAWSEHQELWLKKLPKKLKNKKLK